MPAIYHRVLTVAEIRERCRARGLTAASGPGLLGCWPLSEEKGEIVADSSGQGRHGRIINLGTWMIGGPSFDESLPRFGNYDPAADRSRGHGLRLASDDLYDCRWQPTFTVKIPDDARSGIYVGRIRFLRENKPRLYHTLFIVTKGPGPPPRTDRVPRFDQYMEGVFGNAFRRKLAGDCAEHRARLFE